MTNNFFLNKHSHYKILLFLCFGLTATLSSQISWAQTTIKTSLLVAQQSSQNLKITSIIHNGSDRPLTPADILTIEMKGTAGVEASFLVIGDKQRVQEIPAREIAPGVYQTRIPVSPQQRILEGAIVGRLQQGTQVVYSAASQAFSYDRGVANGSVFPLSLQPPTTNSQNILQSAPSLASVNSNLQLQFTSHNNGDEIDPYGFKIQGQTNPNAMVKITVTSKLPLVGNFIQVEGDTLIDRTITANTEGIFQLTIPPTTTAPSGLQYIIDAVAISNNQTSQPTQLTLVQP